MCVLGAAQPMHAANACFVALTDFHRSRHGVGQETHRSPVTLFHSILGHGPPFNQKQESKVNVLLPSDMSASQKVMLILLVVDGAP